MKQYIFLACICLLFFAGCSAGGEDETPQTKTETAKTTVQFLNEHNPCGVSVYQSASREIKIAEAGKGAASGTIAVSKTQDTVQYFFTYHLVVEGVPFNYEALPVIARIDEGKANVIHIPSLSEFAGDEKTAPEVYLKIENKSVYSLSLNHNNTEKTPFGKTSPIIMKDETVYYIVYSGEAGAFAFMKNATTPIPFPGDVTRFEAGHLYSFSYDGAALTKTAEKTFSIAGIIAGMVAPPEGISTRAADTGGSITISWNSVTDAAGYNIYYSLSEEGPYTKRNTTLITGTTYTDTEVTGGITYYYKAATFSVGTEGPPSSAVPGTIEAITLDLGVWKYGYISSVLSLRKKCEYYSFSAVGGRTYYIEWDSSGFGSGGVYTADIKVSATEASTVRNLFSNEYFGYGSDKKSVQLTESGYVVITVEPFYSSSGSYRIRYSE